jgi:hypothetical protein
MLPSQELQHGPLRLLFQHAAPVLDGLAIPKAQDVHVRLRDSAARGWQTHQGSLVRAAHGQASRDDIALSDEILDREAQVREGPAQHHGQ